MPKTTAQGWGAEGTNALEPDYFEKQGERWPGKVSSESSKKPAKRWSVKKTAPSPAPTTELPSRTDQTGSSTADSTAGSTEADK